MGNKFLNTMSYYYGYDYYGEEAPKDDKPPKGDMHDKEGGKKMPPILTAYALVPILEGVSWYVTDDKWSAASNSDWDNATMSFLAKTVFNSVALLSVIIMKSPMTGKIYHKGAGLSAVWGLANGYLLYAASDSASSDSNSTVIASVCTGASTLLSVGAYMAMNSKGKDWEQWGKKDGDKPPPKEGDDKDPFGGFGYYDYGYY